MATQVNYHAEPGDKFDVNIETVSMPYGVIHIRDGNGVVSVSIFTPSGINCAADYLREFRDVLDGAIIELVQMEKNAELKIDDMRHIATGQ